MVTWEPDMVSTKQERNHKYSVPTVLLRCGKKMSLNSLAIIKLLKVLTVLQWLSAIGDVKSDQKIDIAIAKWPDKV